MSLVSTLPPSTASSSSLSSVADFAADIQNYVVAPLAAFGIGGFTFSAQGDSIANLSADITDHYTEDNRALQDHIAIRPKRITLKGYVGEVVYQSKGSFGGTISTLAQKLTTISTYIPVMSNGLQNIASTPGSTTLSSASSLYALTQNLLAAFGNQKTQQNAYNYFRALMESATLMGVQTPWEFMPNMAIESIQAIQDEKGIYITDFSITLKQIRIAVPQSAISESALANGVSAGIKSLQGALNAQAAPITNLGNSAGQALPVSSLIGTQSTLDGVGDISSKFTFKNIFAY